jgi:hypothetical protein
MDGPGPDGPARSLAAVGLSGPVLRYAEAVRGPGSPRLRRLGAVDFDFDAERAVFGGDDDPDGLAAVADALRDVFGGAAPGALVVAAHPTTTTTFFTPLPAGVEPGRRDAQLQEEAALLADVAPARAGRVHAAPVRTEGDRTTWYHVVHVGDAVHPRLSRLADALGAPTYAVVDAARAAAHAAAPGTAAEGALCVGAYAAHTEAAVAEGGALRFAHHGAGADPADTAYFALAAVQHAGLDADAVDRLLVYGDAAAGRRLALVAELLGRVPEPLDPFRPFHRRPDGAPDALASFAPVLGAALAAARPEPGR